MVEAQERIEANGVAGYREVLCKNAVGKRQECVDRIARGTAVAALEIEPEDRFGVGVLRSWPDLIMPAKS